jgi:O-antigen/teichoic acid export membrane protein
MNKQNIKNAIISAIGQVLLICLGLIVPRIILVNYGSDSNGVINTVTQIFTYMALLEAGIGQASRNQLYKPIHENNQLGISEILSVTRRYFRKISYFYAAAVIVLAAGLPFILKTEVPYWTVFFIVFFDGLTNVVSFYFINTWNIFLSASGQSYISTTFDTVSSILNYAVKIVLCLLKFNLAFIQAGYFCVALIKLLIYYVYMKKKYSWIDYKIPANGLKLQDRYSYVLTEIAGTVFSATDMIVLSIFVSTALSSVYSIYNMVFLALDNLLGAIYFSLNFNLGKAYQVGIEKYAKVHDLFNSIFVGSMACLMCTAYILAIPFIKLYTAGVTDIDYIYQWLPLCFCLVQLLSWSRYVGGNLTGIAGYAKPTSYVSVIEAILNVSLSIAFVYLWGIMGVIIATVVALPVKIIYVNWVSDYKVMKRKPWNTVKIIGINWLIFLSTVLTCYFLNIELSIQNYWWFALYGLIFTIAFAIITFIINGLINHDLFTLVFSRIGTLRNRKNTK